MLGTVHSYQQFSEVGFNCQSSNQQCILVVNIPSAFLLSILCILTEMQSCDALLSSVELAASIDILEICSATH